MSAVLKTGMSWFMVFGGILCSLQLRVDGATYAVRTSIRPTNLIDISEEQISQHWKLYEGYVAEVNKIQTNLAGMRADGKGATPEYMALARRVNFEVDGMVLHEFYFGNLLSRPKTDASTSKVRALAPETLSVVTSSELYAALVRDFGSTEAWRKDFMQLGLSRGIGWVIVYADAASKRLMNCFVADHELGTLAGMQIVLAMDVWEHAYMVDHSAQGRSRYIEAFMKNIAWSVAGKRFDDIIAGRIPRCSY